MKYSSERDLYSILGVNPKSSAEEIRNAYLSRARVIHPDRFDKNKHAYEWEKANEMLAELNDAFAILRNEKTRQEYDLFRSGIRQEPPPPRQDTQSPPHSSFDLGDLTSGYASYAKLPRHIQERLKKRQENKGEEQFQLSLKSLVWNYVSIAIVFWWFYYLFVYASSEPKWNNDTLRWYGVLSLITAILIGKNAISIGKWTKATLKPYFYVTPLYFIKTDYDVISFRPIWTLNDISVTHNYRNGVYQNSSVILKFEGYNESLKISSKDNVEKMFNQMKRYDELLRLAYKKGDLEYFQRNDDFFGVSRSEIPTTTLLSKRDRTYIYLISAVFCFISFWGAHSYNNYIYRLKIRTHENFQRESEQTLPTRERLPRYQTEPEQPLPESGSVQSYSTAEEIAPFEIKASEGSNYFVKLVDANTFKPVLTVFVRSGTTVNVNVPLGTYEVRYASGETWFGYDCLFGEDTIYSKADKTFTFEIADDKVKGFTMTLYKVANGNLHTSFINSGEF